MKEQLKDFDVLSELTVTEFFKTICTASLALRCSQITTEADTREIGRLVSVANMNWCFCSSALRAGLSNAIGGTITAHAILQVNEWNTSTNLKTWPCKQKIYISLVFTSHHFAIMKLSIIRSFHQTTDYQKRYHALMRPQVHFSPKAYQVVGNKKIHTYSSCEQVINPICKVWLRMAAQYH